MFVHVSDVHWASAAGLSSTGMFTERTVNREMCIFSIGLFQPNWQAPLGKKQTNAEHNFTKESGLVTLLASWRKASVESGYFSRNGDSVKQRIM